MSNKYCMNQNLAYASKGIKWFVFVLFYFSFLSICNAQQQIALQSTIPQSPNAAEIGKYGTYPVGTLTGVPDISFNLYTIKSGKLELPISLSYHASGIKVNQRATDVGLGWSIMAGGTISRTVYGSPDEGQYGYFNYTPPSYSSLTLASYFDSLQKYTFYPSYDLEPDLFTYNFAGKSGKFICDTNRKFITIPFEPIKIEQSLDPTNKLIFQIRDDDGTIYQFSNRTLTLNSGTYPTTEFTPNVRTTISSWSLTRMISNDLADTISFEYENQALEDAIEEQSYPLGKIIVDSTKTSSEFKIGPIDQKYTYINYNELLIKEIRFRGGYVQFNRDSLRKDTHLQTFALNEMLVYNDNDYLIKRINFNYDYFISDGGIDLYDYYRLKLLGFAETGVNDSLGKKYQFEYNATKLPRKTSYNIDYWGYYNGQNNFSLIPETDVYGYELNSVSFNDGLTYSDGLYDSNEWIIGNANREPSGSNMQAGILNKIIYPTGGYTLFDFEPNKYLSDVNFVKQSIVKGGTVNGIDKYTKSESVYSFSYPSNLPIPAGNYSINANLHIEFSVSNMNNSIVDGPQIVTLSDNTNGTTNTWTHTGDLTVAQNMDLNFFLFPGHSYTLKVIDYGDNLTYTKAILSWMESTGQHATKEGGGLRIKSIKNYTSDNKLAKVYTYKYGANEDGLGSKIFDETNFYRNYYDLVVQYFNSDGGEGGLCVPVSEDETLLRNYIGVSNYSALNYFGASVLYSLVTKYEGTPTNNVGKTEYLYDVSLDNTIIPNEFANSGNYGSINNAWSQGELREVADFRFVNGQYYTVHKTLYEYGHFNQSVVQGVRIKQYRVVKILGNCYIGSMDLYTNHGHQGLGYFSLFQYPIKSGASRKVSEVNIAYDDNNIAFLKDSTSISYNNTEHLFPSEITSVKSNDKVESKMIYYPADLVGNNDPTGIHAKMVEKNMQHYKVKEETYIGSNLHQYTRQFYSDAATSSSNMIVPISSNLYDKSDKLLRQLNYNSYNSYGNPMELEFEGDRMAKLYDYKSQYLVCEAKSCKVTDISYTSFEADGTGGWTISSNKRIHSSGITGNSSYDLSNGSVFRYGLSSGVEYILSYWTKNTTPFTIAGTEGNVIAGRTVDGWTYFQHLISGVSQIEIPGISGMIDELRLYPKGSSMETFTYEPLIGLTSKCDLNSRLTYFEYDELNRLILVRDDARNVIKKYCYNYSGDSGNCNIFYSNAASVTLTKNNCSIGEGSSVIFSVPAGKYHSTVSQSAADDLVQAEIDKYGQEYANANGSCVFYNVAESGTFTRNNCGSGYLGSQITYSVAAGTYSSTISQADANQLALDDISANGQNYANVNGTCTLIQYVTVSLKNLFSGAYPNPISLQFIQNGSPVYTFSFPSSRTGSVSVSVPAGNYQLKFSVPSGFESYPLTYSLSPGGGNWTSANVTTSTLSFSYGTSYTITASNYY